MADKTRAAAVLAQVHGKQLSARDALALLKAEGGSAEAAESTTPTIAPHTGTTAPIAVIGMAGQFPGAPDVATFWENLLSGTDSVGPLATDRWQDPLDDPAITCRAGGFLSGADQFDPLFFGLSAREALHIDPQQRLFLMEAWRALEQAGYAGEWLEGAPVGVFVGCAEGDYADLLRDRGQLHNSYAFMGNASAILSARLSYALNLKGPAVAFDTACSASLVALHYACESLRRGECEKAIAGGTYVMSTPRLYRLASSADMLSATGRCQAFGAGADGFVPAEAVGAVILKPLDQALRDGDHVHAVIEGSGLNQDGRSNGITAPNGPSQTALERQVYNRFGVDPANIRFVETHGTGTALGDPIELAALADAFADGPERCWIGSAKSNIGHAQLAAGIVGFIKMVCALESGEVPPTLHATEPNPHLGLDDTPFRLPQCVEPFPAGADGVRHGAVSSFGFSGTNAHVVLRSAPESDTRATGTLPCLILLSGRDVEDLRNRARNLLGALDGDITLPDVALTLLTGRAHLPSRAAAVFDDLSALRRWLIRIAERADVPNAAGKVGADGLANALLSRLPEKPEGFGDGARKALEKVAEAYEAGANVTRGWHRILCGQTARRRPLPGTVFRTSSYWPAPLSPKSTPAQIVVGSDDPLPGAHLVQGQPVLPGAALVAFAVARLSPGEGLTDVRFPASMTPDGDGSIRLSLRRDDDSIRLETRAGTVGLTASVGKKPVAPPLDQTSTGAPVDIAGLYDRFDAAGLQYGDSLRGLLDLHRNGDHLVASAHLPTARAARPGSQAIPAELLDICWQAVGGFAPEQAAMPMFVPSQIGSVTLLNDLPDRVQVVMVREAGGTDKATLQVSLDVLAPDGTRCLAVRGLKFSRISQAIETGETVTCHPVWLPIASTAGSVPGHLRLVTAGPWGKALAENLQSATERGDIPAVTLFTTEPGLSDGPLDRALADTLMRARTTILDLLTRDETQQRILHLYPAGDMAGAALAGFWRSACAEYPSLTVRSVAVGTSVAASHSGLAEALVGFENIRGLDHWRLEGSTFERHGLVEAPSIAAPLPLNQGDVVLIAGAGGAGTALAEHLVQSYGAQVALLSRSQTDSGTPGVTNIAADLTNASSVEQALIAARQLGPVKGVIHTAGINVDAPLSQLDLALAKRVARPKIFGVQTLDQATRGDPLAFFVTFGALVSHVGNAGQGAYGFANAWLAAFTQWRDARQKAGDRPGVSRVIGWPILAAGGMDLPDALANRLAERDGLHPMPPAQMFDAIAAAVAGDAPELVVAYGSAPKLRAALMPAATALAKTSPPSDNRLREALVGRLCDMVQAALSVEGVVVEPDVPISDYGFDSIAVTGLIDDLNSALGTRLNPAALYGAKTMWGLADNILASWPDEAAGALNLPVSEPVPIPATRPKAVEAMAALTAPAIAVEPNATRIAIVGFDLRFPGAADPQAFRALLDSETTAPQDIPLDRWDWRALDGDPAREAGRTNVHKGYFLKDVDRFDAAFFGISPVEARLLDPQQRLLLQASWRALEHAGIAPASIRGSNTGVFVGCAGYDYATLVRASAEGIEGVSATGVAPSLMSNRLSYHFDLTGPSETVDTACSSSLVALDKAIKALRLGTCDTALVGGASLILTPEAHLAFSRAGMLSPGGQCLSFDARADGYARGEGVAVVVLKPLDTALRDGNRIHAVLRGSAVNHGGRASSLTAPNPEAQATVLTRAWKDAGILAAQIGYIEAHGTGTKLGDPIEIEGLKTAIANDGPGTAPTTIAVSTIKARMGHLEGTAGLAGLLNAVYAVRDGVVPGNGQVKDLNPLIDLGDSGLGIPGTATRWPDSHAPRLAGVSSFGFGGTNAHVVVEQPPASNDTRAEVVPLVVLSAQTAEDLRARAEDLLGWIEAHSSQKEHRSDETQSVIQAVVGEVAALLDVDATSIAADAPFSELGLAPDQLVELALRLQTQLGAPVARARLSVDASATDIAREFGRSDTPEHRPESDQAGLFQRMVWTLQAGRDAMPERLAFLAGSLAETADCLRAILGTDDDALPDGVYRQKAERLTGVLGRAMAGPLGRKIVEEAVETGQLLDVAELFAQGAAIDWHRITQKPPTLIDLPAYRFRGQRFWVQTDKPSVALPHAPQVHRLTPVWTDLDLPKQHAISQTRCDFFDGWREASTPVLRAESGQNAAAVLWHLKTQLQGPGSQRMVAVVGAGNGLALAEMMAAFVAGWSVEASERATHILWAPNETALNSGLHVLETADVSQLRGDRLLTWDNETLRVRQLAPATSDAVPAPLPAHPVILITGGFGAVGRRVAEHLADRSGARLILVGRNAPEDAVALAERLTRGTPPLFITGDLTKPQDLNRVLTEGTDHFGRIDLIIHAAGALANSFVKDLTEEQIVTATAAKCDALSNLLDLTTTPRVIAFSSLAGWIDAPGQAAYAAANRYVDGLALSHPRLNSIAWPALQQVGMAKASEGAALLEAETGIGALAMDAALDQLDRMISAPVDAEILVPMTSGKALPEVLTSPFKSRVSNGIETISAADLIIESLGLTETPDPMASLDALGLSSLTAMRLVNEIRNRRGVSCKIADLVAQPTFAALVAFLDQQTAVDPPRSHAPMKQAGGPETEAQAQIALHQAIYPDSYAYTLPILFDAAPELTVDRVRGALNQLAAAYATLRTRILRTPDGFTRIVDEPGPIPFDQADSDNDAAIQRATQMAFDPAKDWPIRALWIDKGDGPNQLLLTLHHSAVDGMSLPILRRSLERALAGEPIAHETVTYDDYAVWQGAYLEQADADREWWQSRLSKRLPVPLNLPNALARPKATERVRGDFIEMRLTPTQRDAYHAARVGNGVTPAAALMAEWVATLSRYAEEPFVRLVVPTAGNRGGQFADLVGLVMNPVVVEVEPKPDQRIGDMAKTLARNLNEALTHANWPISRVLEHLGADHGRGTGFADLTHAAYLFQQEAPAAGGLLRLQDTLHQVGEFPLALEAVYQDDGGLRLILKFDPDSVDTATAQILLDTVTERVITAPSATDATIAELRRATGAEAKRLAVWGQGRPTRHDFTTLDAAFRAIVARAPNAIAVENGTGQRTYSETDRDAEVIAQHLIAAGVAPGAVVAVAVDRDTRLPAILLGVMRAGAAYLPIDIDLPDERVTHMLAASDARFGIGDRLSGQAVRLIDVDRDPPHRQALPAINPDDRAYVIFTSGSTGKPKGVEVTHGNLIAFLSSMVQEPGIGTDDVVLALTTVSFDISGLELFAPLLVGARIALVGKVEARDAPRLAKRLERSGVTVAQATPSTWRMLLASGWTGAPSLKKVLVGGEPLPRDLRDRLCGAAVQVWNMYGPTETTIWSATGRMGPDERVTVGGPIAGTTLHVMHETGQPTAPGIAGELWIGGAGVARGYIGQLDLTAERFVTLPDGARAYRTGDLARWLSDGRLEILGRIDSQIKLRGHRIEVEEIEATVLERIGDTACAVVVGRTPVGTEELVAHVVPTPATRDLSPTDRMRRLQAWLPEAMIPVIWRMRDAMPVTPAGKLDRKALTTTPVTAPETASAPEPASGVTLKKLTEIVATTLNRPAAECDPDLPFRLLGVTSMALVDLAKKVSAAFGVEITPTAFFDHPSLDGMAAYLDTLTPAEPVANPTPTAPSAVSAKVAALMALQPPDGTAQDDWEDDEPVEAPKRLAPPASQTDAIAIIGMAGQFPDAPDLETYWANLLSGHRAFREVPAERWDWQSLHDERRNIAGRSYSRWIAPLGDIAGFDPGYFGMTAHEALCTDPQQRLFLMQAIHALADAGLAPEAMRGQACSVHVGAAMGDYHRLLEQRGEMNAFAMSGNSPSLISGRLAYHLDLHGRAATVDTACSSSLVAVHDACRDLQTGEAELAIAGGVYVMTTPWGQVLSAGANILSPVGQCRPFDAAADGIVIGEGVAALVLKRLDRAVAEGDRIHAVIRSSAVNQDGRTNGVTAPSGAAQGRLIRTALERADLDPGALDYIEAHGTGTRLGDPIEVGALRAVLDGRSADRPCYLGSVKANIGHAYQAAGIAGLIKAALVVKHGMVPPQPGLAAVNPELRLDNSGLCFASEPTALAEGGTHRAGVSSFGFSGTNAHIILETPPTGPDAPRFMDPVPVRFTLTRHWPEGEQTAPPPPAPAPQPEADCVTGAVLGELETLAGRKPQLDDLLEADLGCDSIKVMSLLSRFGGGADTDAEALAKMLTVRDLLAVLAPETAVEGAKAPAPSGLLSDIATASGRDPQTITPGQSLEADLGIDSIKLMGLLSRYGSASDGSGPDMSAIRTVGDLLAALGAGPEPLAASAPAPAPAPSSGPHEIPVLPAQRLFLLGHHLIDSSSLCSWIELRGPLDRAALQQAWQHLVDVSPGLRVTFAAEPGATHLRDVRAFLSPTLTVPDIALLDWSDLDAQTQERRLQSRFEDGLNRTWDIATLPLHQVSVVRLAPDRHALFLTDEHLIVDGVGNQRLMARLLDSYAALISGTPLPQGETDGDFVDRVTRLAAHGAGVDGLMPPGEPYQWDVAQRPIDRLVPRFTAEVVEHDRDMTMRLQSQAQTFGGSMNALLSLALARAAHRTGATPGPVNVQIPTAGRAGGDVDAMDVVGCFAQNLPVEIPANCLTAPWSEALPHYADHLATLLAEEADWAMAVALAEVIEADVPLIDGTVPTPLRPVFRARLRSNLYAPYIGETGLPVATGGLTIKRYRAGTVNGAGTVDLLHEIHDGKLHSSWNWDAQHFAPGDIQALRSAFEAELQSVLGLEARESTQSAHAAATLPETLKQALYDLLGRDAALAPETRLEADLGLDSLRRVRLLTRLPASVRADKAVRRAFLGAQTVGGLASAMGGAEPAATPDTAPIHQIVAQMQATPDTLAVQGPGGSLTYASLDRETAALARRLIDVGAGTGTRVALLLPRGHWFIAGAVAVMRSGAAYVPLDPGYPADRLRYIVEHSEPGVLLTVSDLAEQARALLPDTSGAGPQIICLDVPGTPTAKPQLPRIDPDNPMVILYTSGSTGRPKGVELNHRGYRNRFDWHQSQFSLHPGERVLQKTSICFDVSVWELFWPLTQGGVVHAMDGAGASDPWEIADILRDESIAVTHFVPSMFGEFLSAMEAEPTPPRFPALRWIILSGEALPPALVRRWFALMGADATPLANLYGPTEASIDVTCEVLRGPPEPEAVRIAIGAAIDNVPLYVLGPDGHPLPQGETGELAIGGVQLARGYFRAPELTAKAFVTVDLPDAGPTRLYRTGDLARRLPDGRYDYLGRRDNQVKLRGYRIELDEIEAVLRAGDGVEDATVAVDGDGAEARLVAFCTPAIRLDLVELRALCAARLPDWMVPAEFILLDRLPKTANGKLDRKALAAPGPDTAPLAPAQKWLIQHFPPPYAWWGYTRFTVFRDLQPDLMTRVFHALADRHEAMRTIYLQSAQGEWEQRVLPARGADCVRIDQINVAGWAPVRVDAAIETSLRHSCQGFQLDRLPLTAALILRYGPAHWEVCLSNHHITGDFVTSAVLFREFWDLYDRLAAGDAKWQNSLPAPAAGPTAFALALQRLDETGALHADRAMWEESLCDVPEGWLIPDDDTAPNLERDFTSHSLTLDQTLTRHLQDGCRRHLGHTFYTVAAAALYAALAEVSASERVAVSHRMAGRVSGGNGLPDVTESVGNYAVQFPVPVDVADLSIATLANAVANALAAVPRQGVTYDWVGPDLGRDLYPDTRVTPVRLNYLGVVPPERQGDFLFPAADYNQRFAPPDQVRSADLEIHLAIRDGALSLTAGWAGARWECARVEGLMQRYKERLTRFAKELAAWDIKK